MPKKVGSKNTLYAPAVEAAHEEEDMHEAGCLEGGNGRMKEDEEDQFRRGLEYMDPVLRGEFCYKAICEGGVPHDDSIFWEVRLTVGHYFQQGTFQVMHYR